MNKNVVFKVNESTKLCNEDDDIWYSRKLDEINEELNKFVSLLNNLNNYIMLKSSYNTK